MNILARTHVIIVILSLLAATAEEALGADPDSAAATDSEGQAHDYFYVSTEGARRRWTTGRCLRPANSSTSILNRASGWPATNANGLAHGDGRGHRERGSTLWLAVGRVRRQRGVSTRVRQDSRPR